MNEKYLEVYPGKHLKYSISENKGKSVILLMHGITARCDYYDILFKELKNDYELITFDFPGHGNSFRTNAGYTLDFMTGSAKRLIDSLVNEKLYLFGFSMGGRVALNLMLKHKGIAASAIIVDAGPRIDKNGLKMMMDAQKALPDYFEGFDALKRFLVEERGIRDKECVKRSMMYYFKEEADGRVVTSYDRKVWDVELDKVEEESKLLEEGVSTIDVPIMILRGEHSSVLNKIDALDFHKSLKKGKFIEIKDTTHALLWEKTEEAVLYIKDFYGKIHQ
jgi:pimeloyl-ACP methyl ester carboxylesterase